MAPVCHWHCCYGRCLFGRVNYTADWHYALPLGWLCYWRQVRWRSACNSLFKWLSAICPRAQMKQTLPMI